MQPSLAGWILLGLGALLSGASLPLLFLVREGSKNLQRMTFVLQGSKTGALTADSGHYPYYFVYRAVSADNSVTNCSGDVSIHLTSSGGDLSGGNGSSSEYLGWNFNQACSPKTLRFNDLAFQYLGALRIDKSGNYSLVSSEPIYLHSSLEERKVGDTFREVIQFMGISGLLLLVASILCCLGCRCGMREDCPEARQLTGPGAASSAQGLQV
mmetsp:Transcript_84131/g.241861  ORF Transcript_84131/g.241861 Transcript_84131/m.241861 type:complete len:212 (+) Transcript_84131:106-741(+)